VSFGAHVFPFAGIQLEGTDAPALPLLPIRIRTAAGRWSRPFNAVIDTGSTGCLVESALARQFGLSPEGEAKAMRGAGGHGLNDVQWAIRPFCSLDDQPFARLGSVRRSEGAQFQPLRSRQTRHGR
jgi:hypothetical protein